MKKSQADPMKLIVVAVILLIAMVVIITIFRGVISKETNITITTIDRIGSDSDCDGVQDIFDYCPQDSKVTKKDDVDKKSDCKDRSAC